MELQKRGRIGLQNMGSKPRVNLKRVHVVCIAGGSGCWRIRPILGGIAHEVHHELHELEDDLTRGIIAASILQLYTFLKHNITDGDVLQDWSIQTSCPFGGWKLRNPKIELSLRIQDPLLGEGFQGPSPARPGSKPSSSEGPMMVS